LRNQHVSDHLIFKRLFYCELNVLVIPKLLLLNQSLEKDSFGFDAL